MRRARGHSSTRHMCLRQLPCGCEPRTPAPRCYFIWSSSLDSDRYTDTAKHALRSDSICRVSRRIEDTLWVMISNPVDFKLYYKFCITLPINCTTFTPLVEILSHSNHKFCAILIITPCLWSFNSNYDCSAIKGSLKEPPCSLSVGYQGCAVFALHKEKWITYWSRNDEVRLRVEVAAENVVTVPFQCL